jgi:hypothetical protein
MCYQVKKPAVQSSISTVTLHVRLKKLKDTNANTDKQSIMINMWMEQWKGIKYFAY